MQQGTSRDWAAAQEELTRFARSHRLFFVGGAPRSGTTWLQQMLNAHPDVCCQGEGLFLNHLTVPLENMMAARGQVIEGKNRGIFSHTGGYLLPDQADVEFLAGTAIVTALHRQMSLQSQGRVVRAVGEKTPENVFFFPRLQRLFPHGKFIAIARDPRDVLASAWHFFANRGPGEDGPEAREQFIRMALPSLAEGARAMVAFERMHPADCALVTYERMQADPAPELARLFRLLGVSDRADVVADCIEKFRFQTQTGGRPAGQEMRGAFLRKGVVGDWREIFSDDLNRIILAELGWMYPIFAWEA